MNAHSLLSARGIRKTFGQFVALNNIDFDLPAGEKHALIGPNGAGKSTTFKMLSGLLKPTSGEARIAGVDDYIRKPIDDATLARKIRMPHPSDRIAVGQSDMSPRSGVLDSHAIAGGKIIRLSDWR